MKVFISGVTGYIGSRLVPMFLAEGATVGGFSRSTHAVEGADIHMANITRPLEHSLDHKYDVFIHLAAANDVDSSDPATALSATALGTRYCLDFCKKNGIRKFIYFSTFQVLGKATGVLSEETYPEPVNDYGITHLFAEEYVKMYHRTSGIDYLILRPTNIYGAPLNRGIDRWSLVPNCFCREAAETGQITLTSSGKQKRDFVNLSDLLNITLLFTYDFEKYRNQLINVSSGNDFTILEIAEMVRSRYEHLYGKTCRIEIRSGKPEETNRYTMVRDKVLQTGYSFCSRNTILEEIDAIFSIFNKN
jgi:UDP-glucose 4-epimerase